MDVKVYGEVKLKLELPDALMALLERCVAVQAPATKVNEHSGNNNAPTQADVPDTLPEPTVEVKPAEVKAEPEPAGAAPVAEPAAGGISCDDLRRHIAQARKQARSRGADILSNPEIKAKMESMGAAKMTDLDAAQIVEMVSWVDEVSSNA